MWVCLVCLRLCKEEGSSPVSAITERRDMGLYEVPLSMSLLGFGMGTMLANFQTTQPTSSGAVTAVTNCCANCVKACCNGGPI